MVSYICKIKCLQKRQQVICEIKFSIINLFYSMYHYFCMSESCANCDNRRHKLCIFKYNNDRIQVGDP